MPALAIPIHDLDSSGKDFVFALDASWYGRAFAVEGVRGDASEGPGSVNVHAQRNGREILVHGHAHARLIAQCGRCLGDVPVDVTCDLAALYAPVETRARRHGGGHGADGQGAGPKAGQKAGQKHGHGQQDDDDDLDIDPDAPDREFYTGEQVVIDDLVRDYLLLELPMQPRCEQECSLPGVGTSSRAAVKKDDAAVGEDAIDPRLMPLKKLAQREPEMNLAKGGSDTKLAEGEPDTKLAKGDPDKE